MDVELGDTLLMLIYNGNEVVAMISLPEMDKFVDYDVFDAPQRLFGEFEV